MQLEYKTRKLEKECNDIRKATRAYGDKGARKLHQRVQELRAADSLEEMVAYHIGGCHQLHGDRKGEYALELSQPYRLIVEPVLDSKMEVTGVKVVKRVEVVDYHGN